MYINFNEYVELYGTIHQPLFNRLAYDASKHIDRYTTGVDGVRKLKTYWPADPGAVEAVKHCAAEIVFALQQIQEAEQSASLGRGYVQGENGLHGKVVSSVSAGNESVTYTVANTQATAYDLAASDIVSRDKLIRDIVRKHLAGETDVNGVNLLYAGVYPRV